MHGHEEGTASVVGTATTCLCQMAGVGILGLPVMLAQGGWMCIVLVVLCAATTNYTGKLIIRCCYDAEGQRVRTSYSEIGYAAFGCCGRSTARVFELATLFGVSALFLILAGTFTHDLVSKFGKRPSILVGSGVLGVPLLVLRTVSELKIMTLLGVLAVAVVVVAVVVESSIDFLSPDYKPVTHDLFLPLGFPEAFSTMTLAFSCHAGLPVVEKVMAKPSSFDLSFNIAYVFLVLLYLPVAFLGYLVYGADVKSPILESLPPNWSITFAMALIIVHVLFTYVILMILVAAELESMLGIEKSVQNYIAKRTGVRFATMVLATGVALFVPYFEDMMSLIGAVGTVATTFVMPTLFYIKLKVKSPFENIVPMLVATLGLVAGAIGAYQALDTMIKKIRSGS